MRQVCSVRLSRLHELPTTCIYVIFFSCMDWHEYSRYYCINDAKECDLDPQPCFCCIGCGGSSLLCHAALLTPDTFLLLKDAGLVEAPSAGGTHSTTEEHLVQWEKVPCKGKQGSGFKPWLCWAHCFCRIASGHMSNGVRLHVMPSCNTTVNLALLAKIKAIVWLDFRFFCAVPFPARDYMNRRMQHLNFVNKFLCMKQLGERRGGAS